MIVIFVKLGNFAHLNANTFELHALRKKCFFAAGFVKEGIWERH